MLSGEAIFLRLLNHPVCEQDLSPEGPPAGRWWHSGLTHGATGLSVHSLRSLGKQWLCWLDPHSSVKPLSPHLLLLGYEERESEVVWRVRGEPIATLGSYELADCRQCHAT